MSRGLADLVGFRYDSDLNDKEDGVDVPLPMQESKNITKIAESMLMLLETL